MVEVTTAAVRVDSSPGPPQPPEVQRSSSWIRVGVGVGVGVGEGKEVKVMEGVACDVARVSGKSRRRISKCIVSVEILKMSLVMVLVVVVQGMRRKGRRKRIENEIR